LRRIVVTIAALAIFIKLGCSQAEKPDSTKAQFLTAEGGLIGNNYNSFGLRTFFEYQKQIKENWLYGISYEHSRHMFRMATDMPHSLESNVSLLSLNGYYSINLIKNRLFWLGGIGVGAVHAYWDESDYFGVAANASLTLNVRITKRFYITSSPLIVLMPMNRGYFSPMEVPNYKDFGAFTFFPFGVKVKI